MPSFDADTSYTLKTLDADSVFVCKEFDADTTSIVVTGLIDPDLLHLMLDTDNQPMIDVNEQYMVEAY